LCCWGDAPDSLVCRPAVSSFVFAFCWPRGFALQEMGGEGELPHFLADRKIKTLQQLGDSRFTTAVQNAVLCKLCEVSRSQKHEVSRIWRGDPLSPCEGTIASERANSQRRTARFLLLARRNTPGLKALTMPATADLVQELVTIGGFGDIMDQASLIYGFVRDELTRIGILDDFIQMKRRQRGYF
jgi:hypothetical protein